MALTNPQLEWVLVQSYDTTASEKEFWIAIEIYTTRSHVINRRLIGEEILCTVSIHNEQQHESLKHILSNSDNFGSISNMITSINNLSKSDQDKKTKVAIFKMLLPKDNSIKHVLEVVVNDYAKNHVAFETIKSGNNVVPYFPYAFSYGEGKLNLWVEKGVDTSDKSYQWIVLKLVPKLRKWMEEVQNEPTVNIHSLSLVAITDYSRLYNKLKQSYGKQLVEIWPENTDPLKFVYEDIGIATYLLLLWAGKPKQRFVDLGCGNGLLVHILNSEGHLGVGYDLRPRKIWDMYPPSTKLEVKTIIPSSDTIFPDADWLIGNHSDELTVWIPVMAAYSSYTCNFFLLPCCPFEFNGKKYCRSDTSISQYSDFLNYVETVCKVCGICTEKDKLRIPSTKRTCFVGTKRIYPAVEFEENLKTLQKYIDSKCYNGEQICDKSKTWCPQFKPRGEERVRNCTQIHSAIRESIVNLVVDQLLIKRRLSEDGAKVGSVIDIGELVKVIPQESLKQLKNECGGLQTLLKNHHYIFKVEGGKVQFRVPSEKNNCDPSNWKKKPCWFYHNHPNSCPLLDEKCSFIHGYK